MHISTSEVSHHVCLDKQVFLPAAKPTGLCFANVIGEDYLVSGCVGGCASGCVSNSGGAGGCVCGCVI